MNQKLQKEIRDKAYSEIEQLLPLNKLRDFQTLGDLIYLGRDKEGLVFQIDEPYNHRYIVLRAIVKAEDFNGYDSVEAYEKKQAEKVAKSKE